MIAKNDARMVQGIKRLLHEEIGMGWRDRYNTEEDARATWLAAGHPREGFKDFLEPQGAGGIAAASTSSGSRGKCRLIVSLREHVESDVPGGDALSISFRLYFGRTPSGCRASAAPATETAPRLTSAICRRSEAPS